MPRQLRFAVGSADDPVSTVWRVWEHRNEVYVAARAVLYFKLSLHSSGVWTGAWTAESGYVPPETGNRRHFTWRRPPEFRQGWTQGPGIVVPRLGDEPRIPADHPKPARDVVWVDPPAIGSKVTITFLFATRGAQLDEPLRAGDRMIASLRRESGDTLYLAGREEPLSDEETAHFAQLTRDLRVTPGEGSGPESIDGATLVELGTDLNGLPLFADLSLSRENIGAPVDRT